MEVVHSLKCKNRLNILHSMDTQKTINYVKLVLDVLSTQSCTGRL